MQKLVKNIFRPAYLDFLLDVYSDLVETFVSYDSWAPPIGQLYRIDWPPQYLPMYFFHLYGMVVDAVEVCNYM